MKIKTFYACALALVLTLLLATTAAQADTIPDDFTALDSHLQAQLDRAGIPGATLVIVSRDRVLHLRAFAGGANVAPTISQLFLLGSLSKSVTAMAVMQLVDAGKVTLDAPVRRYIPWFRVGEGGMSDQITVRQLLNQTSAISKRDGMLHFAENDQSPGALERCVRTLADAHLVARPGQRWEYSNMNYVVLGYLIETLSGQSYEDSVRGLARSVAWPLVMGVLVVVGLTLVLPRAYGTNLSSLLLLTPDAGYLGLLDARLAMLLGLAASAFALVKYRAGLASDAGA